MWERIEILLYCPKHKRIIVDVEKPSIMSKSVAFQENGKKRIKNLCSNGSVVVIIYSHKHLVDTFHWSNIHKKPADGLNRFQPGVPFVGHVVDFISKAANVYKLVSLCKVGYFQQVFRKTVIRQFTAAVFNQWSRSGDHHWSLRGGNRWSPC